MRTIPRQAWIIWACGQLAYMVAVLHRSSFGVVGLVARERFEISASVLAGFAVLQLLVYAALQIPVGMALDRWGSRTLIVIGGVVMATGQTVLALAPDVGVAYLGRILVGAGDAATFISVLRLVPAWFPADRAPLITQLTGLVGQLGQILSAVPLAAVVAGPGWRPAFLGCAAVGAVIAVAVLATVRDSPPGAPSTRHKASLRDVGRDLVEAWRHPGTRLGLWTHFSTQFPGTVFSLMWGYPFLVAGEGRTRAEAGALLSLLVLVGLVTGPLLGLAVQRHPMRRGWLVLGIISVNVISWTAVLLQHGRSPLWLLVVLVVCLAVGGPGSMIGFDFARTFNPPSRLGTATGIVNVGGFVASLVTIELIGVILDLRGATASTSDVTDFRWAMSVQYVVWAVGTLAFLLTRRRLLFRLRHEGVVVPPLLPGRWRRAAAVDG